MPKKKICVVTGARSDYNYLDSVLEKIIASEKLELLLLVTGIHLLKKYGNTIDIIKKDGFPIKKVIPMYEEYESKKENLGNVVGKAIIGFTEAFSELNPDLLLVLGDRYEPLAAVIVASTLSIPIAHIHGGDNVFQGQVDEQIRHAITKFAHLHFPATEKSAKRVRLLGEEEWRIHMVGSPTIDKIKTEMNNLLSKEDLCKKFDLKASEKIILCLQHPYILESEKAGQQMRAILQILKDLDLQTIIIYPNNDLGSHLIINEIEANKNVPKFKIFKNLERRNYLSLLNNVDLLIGNSSGGLIESPIFKLPVVNIGDRNKGRESAENVINVAPDSSKIREGVTKGLSEKFKSICKKVKNPYGDGKASDRIVKIIENLKFNENLLKKRLAYEV